MTRKEQEKLKEKNYIAKRERIIKTLEVFMDNDGKITDERLAEALSLMEIKTSSSTVGRDLSENLKEILDEEIKRKNYDPTSPELSELLQKKANILAFVKKARKDNKKEGNAKGGLTSSRNNNIERDENGKFNGCRKKN